MKQKLLNKLWLRVGMIVAIMTTALSGTAWADPVTVSMTSFTAISGNVDEDANISYEAAKGTASTAPAVNSGEIRVYQNGGTFTVTANNEVKINSVTLGSSMGTTVTYSVDGGTASSNQTIVANGTITISDLDCSSVLFTCTGTDKSHRLYVNSLSVTYTPSGVTPTCATPTFSPAAGAVVSGTKVSISSTEGATIYYTTNGTTPTSNSSVYSAPIEITAETTIKAFASKSDYNDSEVATATYTIKQAVSGYTIDFENDVDDYVDWEFENIGTSNTAISAHGGNKYGANINASGNAVTTASIKTKEAVALPGTITCYVSKTSNNTTTSTWKVQVSSDGSTWTDVSSQDATSMSKGSWVEFTANLSTYSNVYVRIYYSGSNAIRAIDDISITMRDPNAKITPTVTIDDTGITTTDIAGNTNVAAGTLAATVTSGETTINTPAVTWSSSDTDVATVNATTGAVTLIGVGTATITASFAGNDDYTEASTTYELTVIDSYAKGQLNNPYTVAEARAAIDAGTGVTGVYATGIVSEIVTAYNSQYGNISYNISADGLTTSDQLEIYRGKSFNGDNFTSENDIQVGDEVVVYGNLTTHGETYEFAQDNQLVSLTRAKQDPTIPSTPVSVVYGSTHTVTGIVGGEATLTSSNTAVATVEGLVITTVAVGTTTITVTTAENTYYNAGSGTFELTVTAPVGGTEAPTGSAGGTIFEETFAGCESTGGNDGSWSGSIASGNFIDTSTDNSGWNFEHGNTASGCAKFGSTKAGGSATTPALGHAGTLTLTFKAAAWNGSSEGTTLSLSADKATLMDAGGENLVDDVTLEKGAWTTYTLTLMDAEADATITFYTSAGNHRFFLDEVKVVAPATPAPAITATLNGNGYATFCSEYPLDFSEVTDFSAWQITDISSSNEITFEQVTGSVKGGTGLFLKGAAGATVTIPSADSSNELTKNLLVGTLAPSYFAANQIYGLAGDTFKKNSAGSIRPNKAYIPADKITVSSGAKPFTLVFEDDATGISLMEDGRSQMEVGVIYNLAGQRISKMQKGINIVNGKKILK